MTKNPKVMSLSDEEKLVLEKIEFVQRNYRLEHERLQKAEEQELKVLRASLVLLGMNTQKSLVKHDLEKQELFGDFCYKVWISDPPKNSKPLEGYEIIYTLCEDIDEFYTLTSVELFWIDGTSNTLFLNTSSMHYSDWTKCNPRIPRGVTPSVTMIWDSAVEANSKNHSSAIASFLDFIHHSSIYPFRHNMEYRKYSNKADQRSFRTHLNDALVAMTSADV